MSKTIPQGEVKDLPGLLAMLKELKKMGEDLLNEGRHSKHASYKPLFHAVHSNLQAFYITASPRQLSLLYDETIVWLPERRYNLSDYKWHMRDYVETWSRQAKHHPLFYNFIARHCMNVAVKWTQRVSKQK